MFTGTRIYLSTRKGMIKLERQTRGWETTGVSFPGIPVSYAFKDHRTGTLWAALETDHYGSKLQRSLDDGATWENIELPKYPEGAVAGDGSPASLSYIWVIAPGLPDQPERLYLGTEPGGLFQSDNGGETFSLVSGLWEHPSRMRGWFGAGRDHPGVHSIVIDPRNPDRLMVGISVAGVFETVDGGVTWEPRNKGLNATYLPNPQAEIGQDPHLLLACPSEPDVLWQQNHCGIFRSTDGGQNWVEVSQTGGPAFFGFPIAVDAGDPESAVHPEALGDVARA